MTSYHDPAGGENLGQKKQSKEIRLFPKAADQSEAADHQDPPGDGMICIQLGWEWNGAEQFPAERFLREIERVEIGDGIQIKRKETA